MSLSNVEIANTTVEDVESSKAENDTEPKEEMEEGELLEEGELSDAGDNGDVQSTFNNDSKRLVTSARTVNSQQQHKLITDQHYSSSSHSSSKKDKSSKDKSSKDSSSKKRKHEQQAILASDTKISSTEDVNDVETFLKKKKLELAEKVKNQLRLAGGEPKGESGDESEAESKNATTNRTQAPHSAPKRPSISEGTSSAAAKYFDYDKVEDPTETMISNWSKGKHPDKSKVRSPTVGYDPYEEYYQSTTPIDNEPSKIDQDFRFGSIVNSADQDYRFGSGYDVDYRRKTAPAEPGFGSPSDASEGGGYSEEEENAANEFGDIDERHRPAASKRLRGRRGGLRNRKGRRYDDSGTESNEDMEHQQDRTTRRTLRPEVPRKRRSRSPLGRRRGLGKDPDRPGGGNDMPLCKFFREGYCREGDACPYSHDQEPLRPLEKKAELCKFYSNGFCRNGQRCPFMHGEYPCKFYHKGDCVKGETCRYSHEQLNEVTRPIYERMLKDEELASKVSVPDAPSRRKVLLGEPPKLGPPPPINGPHPSINHSSYNDAKQSHQDSFAPQANTSSYSSSGHYGGQSAYTGRNEAATSARETHPTMSPLKDVSNNETKDDGAGGDGKVTINITDMLRQIKANYNGEEIQESPASPEPANEPAQFVVVRQPSDLPEYRLISFDLPPRDPLINSQLVQWSLSDPKLANDPRIKKLLSSQFDAVSDMISSQNAAKDQTELVAGKDPRTKADPRLAANVRDPRLKPSAGYPGTSPQQYRSTSPNSRVDPYGLSNVVLPPQNIAAPAPLNYGVGNVNLPITAAVTATNFVPSMPMVANPLLMNPNALYPQSNPMMSNTNGSSAAMGGNLPMSNISASSSTSWMPQINPQSNVVNANNWVPQQMMMTPNAPDLSNQRYNGPVNQQAAQVYNSGPVIDSQTKDPRSRRNLIPNRGYPDPGDYPSPSQGSPDNGDFNTSAPPERFAPGMHRTGSDSSTISLREKRKNLEYESPLSTFAASKSNSSADENRFNTYSGNIKLKKKGSVEDRNEM